VNNLHMPLTRLERWNLIWNAVAALVVAGMLILVVYLARLATTWGG